MINQEQIISKNTSLMQALDIMNRTDRKLLLICEGFHFLGLISIGDVQRALLEKKDLSRDVLSYVRTDITVATTEEGIESIKAKMRKERIESMPIIDGNHQLIDVIDWKDLFQTDKNDDIKVIHNPVVIMAGGKGTRLLPLTNIIPKPLIPISDKTIIEEIMSMFKKAGANEFYISVNYMKETIENYFKNINDWNIEFVYEEKPLGTAGSLALLKNKLQETFFVINCDTLVDVNLKDLIEYHNGNRNVVTMVSVVKKMSIPYGTLETELGGTVMEIKEKPEYVYQINSGMYLLEPEALDYIEENTFTNITDVISKLIEENKKVGAFPVSENAWVDMGNWEEYLKLVEKYASYSK